MAITAHVGQNGWIIVNPEYRGELVLSQKESIDLAIELTSAVRRSIDRNQIGTPNYNKTENILARDESPLGQAYKALKRVFG